MNNPTTFTIGQIISFLPTNNTIVREAKILRINKDGSIKALELDKSSIDLWDAGYEVSTTIYPHQIINLNKMKTLNRIFKIISFTLYGGKSLNVCY